MMSVIVLFETPESEGELSTWSFVNAAHHRDIIRIIFEQTGEILPEYPLDPFDPENMNTWLYNHQQMHTAQNAILGIGGWNLLELNLKNPEAVANWIWYHAQEHLQAGQILELG